MKEEGDFSKLVAIKIKYQSLLDPEDDSLLAISNLNLNIKAIIASALHWIHILFFKSIFC